MVQLKLNDKELNDKELTDKELNDLSYEEALKEDKRTYIMYYISLLSFKPN